jgi:hypothetical protein
MREEKLDEIGCKFLGELRDVIAAHDRPELDLGPSPTAVPVNGDAGFLAWQRR